MEQLDIGYNRSKVLMLILQGFGLAALMGALLIFINWTTSSMLLIGVLGLALAGMGFAYMPKLFKNGPVISLTADGFYDSRIMKQAVPWSEIETLLIKPYGAGKNVNLFSSLVFSDEFPHRTYLKGKKWQKDPETKRKVLTSKLISPVGLDIDQRAFLAMVSKFIRPRAAV